MPRRLLGVGNIYKEQRLCDESVSTDAVDVHRGLLAEL